MKISSPLNVLLFLASGTHCHYFFSQLFLNGKLTPEWKFVRDVIAAPNRGTVDQTPLDYAWGKTYPIEDVKSEAIACGREAFRSANTTETVDIKAGEEVGFHVTTSFDGTSYEFSNKIFHTGPAQFYLARAPNDDLSTFKGTDGKWFKIGSLTAAHETSGIKDFWIAFDKKQASYLQINVTIPEATPAGRYLLRVEQIQPGVPGSAQFYASCAHVNIISEGHGVVPEDAYATFPGSYDANDPAINMDFEYYSKPGNYLKYVGPGPKVWTGQTAKRETEFRA